MQHSHDARHLSQNILSSCFHRHSVVTACIFTTHWVVKIIQLTDFPNFTFTCQSIDFIVSRERNIFILQPCTLTFDLDLRTWPRYGRLPDQQGYRRHQTSPPPDAATWRTGPNIMNTRKTGFDQGSSSHRPRYCVTTPIRAGH